MSFALCPLLNFAAIELLQAYGAAEQKRLYLRQARLRRMDRHDELDRAAGRLGPRRADHPRACRPMTRRAATITASPARRSSSPTATMISPTTSSTWCWRALPTRRRAARASRCSWCRNSCPTPTGGLGARNEIRALAPRAQARHPRQPDLRHGLWRRWRRRRLAGRRGKPRPRIHVHDDEQRPARCRAAGCRDRRARLSAGARLCPDARAGQADRRPPAADDRRCRSSIIPTCGACCCRCAPRPRRCARSPITPRRRSTAPAAIPTRPGARAASARRSADPGGQGVVHRSGRRRSPRPASRSMAAWASSRRPAPRSICATPGSRRSTRAPTASRPTTSSAASSRATAARRRAALIAEIVETTLARGRVGGADLAAVGDSLPHGTGGARRPRARFWCEAEPGGGGGGVGALSRHAGPGLRRLAAGAPGARCRASAGRRRRPCLSARQARDRALFAEHFLARRRAACRRSSAALRCWGSIPTISERGARPSGDRTPSRRHPARHPLHGRVGVSVLDPERDRQVAGTKLSDPDAGVFQERRSAVAILYWYCGRAEFGCCAPTGSARNSAGRRSGAPRTSPRFSPITCCRWPTRWR